ncbi:uncharacterized membrane protein-like [Rhopalosiphum padi]|uniref:uncharacterized membrane protein-like n=1 Tax=Rhopalosiphum padi TaxID=40932 RepID=UPI00298DBD76|nr:uncharacterized membrane protein-like [Rhopalosiphum padi]
MTSKRRIKHLLDLANEANNKDDAMNNITYYKKKSKTNITNFSNRKPKYETNLIANSSISKTKYYEVLTKDSLKDIEFIYENVVTSINEPDNIYNENNLNVPNNTSPTTENQVDDSIYDKTDCITNFETDNDEFNNYEDCLKDNIELTYEDIKVVTSIDVPGNISNENNLNVPNNTSPTIENQVDDSIYDKTDCITNFETDNDEFINYDHDYSKEIEIETSDSITDKRVRKRGIISQKKNWNREVMQQNRLLGKAYINMIKYDPTTKKIYYKINFEHEYTELPQYHRTKKTIDLSINTPCLYNSRIPITLSKWIDLQKLKTVLPTDVHDYYDNIPHLKTYKERKCDKI